MKKTVKTIIFTLIGFIIAFYLISQINVHEFFFLWKKISYPLMLFSYFVYLCSYGLRTARWFFLLRTAHLNPVMLFLITSIHTMFNNLLPARTGEFSFVILLKKWKNISTGKGMASLFMARICDLVVMSLFFLISVIILWEQLQVPVVKLVLITVFMVPILLLVLMGMVSRRGIKYFSGFILNTFLGKYKVTVKITGKLEEISHAVHEIKMSKEFIFSVLTSIFVWGVKFFSFFLLIKSIGMGIELGFWCVVLGTTFSELTSVLPVNSVAGIGTIEGGWTIGFLLLGIDKQFVIMSGFAFHIMLLLFSVLTGLMSLFLINILFSKFQHYPAIVKNEVV